MFEKLPSVFAVRPFPLLRLQRLHRFLALALFTVAVRSCFAAKPDAPAIAIPLDTLGFAAPAPRFLAAGASMFSINFVDSSHLLLTYTTKALLKRLDDEPPDDDDRSIAALLLELPTGKVLARTVWRTHDHSRYLWPLGHGYFLLRVRNELTVLNPVGNLSTGDAFRQQRFVAPRGRIGLISTDPDGDVVSIQTVAPAQPPLTGGAAQAKINFQGSEPPDRSTEIYVYRTHIEPGSDGQEHLRLTETGHMRAPTLIQIATTGEGYISIKKERPGTYDFDFVQHSGKKMELSAFDTSCAPRVFFLSRSEFLAFGCRGSEDKQVMSEFDLRGQEPWIANLPGNLYRPFIQPAPDAGRFAFSQVSLIGNNFSPENVSPEDLGGQSVTVFQNHDGRALLKIATSPVQPAGQNFDLSADGRSLAVIREGRIEVYNLPTLTAKDEKEVRLAAASYPERNDAPIRLSAVPVPPRAAQTSVTVDTGRSADAAVVGDAAPHDTAPVISASKPASRAEARRSESGTQATTPADANIVGDSPSGSRPTPSLYDADHPKPPSH